MPQFFPAAFCLPLYQVPFPFPVNPLCLVHTRDYSRIHPRLQGALVAMTAHAKMRNGSSPMAGIVAVLFDQQLPKLRLTPAHGDFAVSVSTPTHFLCAAEKKPKYPMSNSYFGLAAVIITPIAFLPSLLFRTGPCPCMRPGSALSHLVFMGLRVAGSQVADQRVVPYAVHLMDIQPAAVFQVADCMADRVLAAVGGMIDKIARATAASNQQHRGTDVSSLQVFFVSQRAEYGGIHVFSFFCLLMQLPSFLEKLALLPYNFVVIPRCLFFLSTDLPFSFFRDPFFSCPGPVQWRGWLRKAKG